MIYSTIKRTFISQTMKNILKMQHARVSSKKNNRSVNVGYTSAIWRGFVIQDLYGIVTIAWSLIDPGWPQGPLGHNLDPLNHWNLNIFFNIQSGASSRAKIGGAYFSDVTGSIQDPIAVPGPCEVTEP